MSGRRWSLLASWYGLVLPEGGFEESQLDTRARVIAGFVLVEIVTTGAFAVLSPLVSDGWYTPFGVIGVVTGVLAAVGLRRGYLDVAAHLTLVGCAGAAWSGAAFTGGISNPAFAWILFVPLFAGLLTTTNGATVWSILTGIVGLIILWAHVSGRLPPHAYAPAELDQMALDITGMAVVATAVMRLYQRTQDQAQSRLRESLRALENEVAERRRAEVEAREARAAQETFLASISHEIRTPMNGIIGVSELLSRAKLDPQEAAHVEALSHSASTLRRLLTDLLDLSKLRAGGFTLESAPVELRPLLAATVTLHAASVTDIGVRWQCEPEVPEWVLTDETRLSQMVGNLVANAVRHARRRVEVLVTAQDERIVLRIEDDGRGIPEAEREAVLAPFRQLESGEGTGLGLALVAGLAEAMGGSLALEEAALGGAAAVLALPLISSEPSLDPDPLTRDVLVVDDDPVNRLVLRGLLTSLGANVSEAESGEQGLERLREGSYDLVFMDLRLPGISGLEATRTAIAEGVRTPIVCLTASSAARVEEEVAEAGMVGLVTKPVSRAELAAVLARHAGGR